MQASSCVIPAIVSLDGSGSCPGTASGSQINHSIRCPDVQGKKAMKPHQIDRANATSDASRTTDDQVHRATCPVSCPLVR